MPQFLLGHQVHRTQSLPIGGELLQGSAFLGRVGQVRDLETELAGQ